MTARRMRARFGRGRLRRPAAAPAWTGGRATTSTAWAGCPMRHPRMEGGTGRGRAPTGWPLCRRPHRPPAGRPPPRTQGGCRSHAPPAAAGPGRGASGRGRPSTSKRRAGLPEAEAGRGRRCTAGLGLAAAAGGGRRTAAMRRTCMGTGPTARSRTEGAEEEGEMAMAGRMAEAGGAAEAPGATTDE